MEAQGLSRWHYAGLYAALLALLGYIFVWAWVSEDAYITFRVIDNFFHGYGLRWNIDERVQVYTHPLWLLLQLAIHAVWPNLFQATIMLSITCSMAAVMIILFTVQRPLPTTLVCIFLPLVLSKAFMDYTTSGLENPLCYLLYATFGYVFLRKREHPHFWFYCSLTVALALLTRLDTSLFYAPLLAWLVYTNWPHIKWRQVWLGATPLLAWFAFSLFYYGFLFPNTKYAKLGTGIGILNYLQQGWHYTAFMITTDTVSAVIIASSLVFALARRSLPMPPACLMLGIYLYIWYVIAIGGDYMTGRFWAMPVFASVWLAYMYLPDKLRHDMLFAIAGLLLVAYVTPVLLREIHKNCHSCTANQELLINARNRFATNQLVAGFSPLRLRRHGEYVLGDDGRELAKENPPPVKKMYFIGMIGYYAGANVTLVDELALADPLLARLPAARQQFFTGHFRRDIPKGYIYAVRTGNTEHMDPALARYYEKLRLIASGDLTDPERLKTIIAFNLGMYDYWKQDYLSRNRP